MNRVINILTKRKKKEAKKKEKITTITNLFCLLFLGQDNIEINPFCHSEFISESHLLVVRTDPETSSG